MKKEGRRRGSGAGITTALILVAVIAFGIINAATGHIRTETVYAGYSEDSLEASGFLIRTEQLINAPVSGVVSCNVPEESRVHKGQRIADIYAGTVDTAAQNKLSHLNERLAQYENTALSTEYAIRDDALRDTAVAARVVDIVKTGYTGNTEKVTDYKDEINRLLTGVGEEDTTLQALQQQKAELEAGLSNQVHSIYAPAPGVFSSVIDGMEGFFDLNNITPSVLAEAEQKALLQPGGAVEGQPVVKLIDNYRWYFAAVVEEVWLDQLQVGAMMEIRFPELSEQAIPAEITAISQAEEGMVALVLACNHYVDHIYSRRKVNAEIIKNSYRGLRVPIEAVRVTEEGVTGVYRVRDAQAQFREVQVLHRNDTFAIIKEEPQLYGTKSGIALYDEVIVSDEEIIDGETVE